MSNTATISFDINTTNAHAELGVEVWINSNLVYQNTHVTALHSFSHTINDDDADHELRIVMSGKKPDHTKIDDQGNIIEDAMLAISNPAIDGIDINYLFNNKTIYKHDFNGSQDKIVDKFYGNMGCNGVISFEFTTPIYLWLLENM